MAWTTPTSRSTGDLITAGIYNTDLVDNLTYLKGQEVPTNLIAYISNATAPTGWSEYTAARGRAIVGLPASGTNAGTVGTALTDQQDKTHTHTYNTVIAHTHGIPITQTSPGAGNRIRASNASIVTTVNTNSTGSASGTTATSSLSDIFAYIQLMAIKKD